MLGLVGDTRGCEELGGLLLYADDIKSGKMTLDNAKASFSGGEKKLRLTTRYYNAVVKMEVCSLSSADGTSAAMIGMDACVAVNPSDMAELAAMLASVEQTNEKELSTRLMVRLLDRAEAMQGERGVNEEDGAASEALLWCLDHGFELVEVDRSDLFATWGEREKEGVARVLEALEATMWPSMLRKEKDEMIEPVPPLAQAADVNVNAPTMEKGCGNALPKPKESEDFPPMPESLMKDIPNPTDREPEPEEMQGPSGEKLETFFDDFLQKARQVRETALKGEVSDAERRDRAAKMASQLAVFMGLDGDSDENDSD